MKTALKKSVALLLALIFSLSGLLAVGASAMSIIDEISSMVDNIGNKVGEGEQTQITITGSTNSMIIGETLTLTGNAEGIVWSTDNEAVATVNASTGVVTAVSAGGAVITATANVGGNEISGVYAITVTAKSSINITADGNVIQVGNTAHLSGDVEGIYWFSEDTGVATIDSKTGVVTGVSQGRATITASATVGGRKIYGTYEIIVTLKKNAILTWLTNHSILSYSYRYEDNYFYTDKDKAWQHDFGYSALYDIVAPYLTMEYDYVRVHFTYEGKDWMIQLWKGQYGPFFYGCETGVYHKAHSDEEDGVFTFYKCADDENRLMIQTSLYHDDTVLRTGDYKYEFTTPYESTWWSTGFKPGHLTVEEPASELRQEGIITLKNEEMTKLFVEGIEECGFKQVEKPAAGEEIDVDTFYVEGNSVYYRWQNISDAENTMGVKVAGGTLFAINLFAILIAAILFFSVVFGGLLIFIII